MDGWMDGWSRKTLTTMSQSTDHHADDCIVLDLLTTPPHPVSGSHHHTLSIIIAVRRNKQVTLLTPTVLLLTVLSYHKCHKCIYLAGLRTVLTYDVLSSSTMYAMRYSWKRRCD